MTRIPLFFIISLLLNGCFSSGRSKTSNTADKSKLRRAHSGSGIRVADTSNPELPASHQLPQDIKPQQEDRQLNRLNENHNTQTGQNSPERSSTTGTLSEPQMSQQKQVPLVPLKLKSSLTAEVFGVPSNRQSTSYNCGFYALYNSIILLDYFLKKDQGQDVFPYDFYERLNSHFFDQYIFSEVSPDPKNWYNRAVHYDKEVDGFSFLAHGRPGDLGKYELDQLLDFMTSSPAEFVLPERVDSEQLRAIHDQTLFLNSFAFEPDVEELRQKLLFCKAKE